MSYPLLARIRQLKTHNSEEFFDQFMDYVSSCNLTLYPAQEEAILEIFSGNNVILTTPTGSGKSLVALALHFKSFAEGKKSIYTCPIKALVNEKFLNLCALFGPEQVGMMTGDGTVNRNAPIICCTAEILANMALREGEKAPVDHIIMDEFHYYADRERGVAWQIPLLTLPYAHFLLMSATFGETQFFEECLQKLTQRKTLTISSADRPVPLFFEYRESPLEITLEDLVSSKKYPIYIVHFTQRDCAETSQALMSTNFCTSEEKKSIAHELIGVDFSSPYGKEVNRLLRHGIGIHHGGLLPRYRSLVERLAQKGLLKMICGTDTLGVGVNVPIRTVLFTKLTKYDGNKTGILSARDFHQISGRAGRKGFDDSGYVVAQAPEHVIENLKMEAKAAKDPSKAKKYVKKKPPEKDYVPWSEQTFKNLREKIPEKLNSQFQITHGMLLNVLSRKGNGCKDMQMLLRNCHSDERAKAQMFRLAFKLFRALVTRKIIEFVDPQQNNGTYLRVHVDLQEDFSLDHELALYLIDSLKLLDLQSPEYALDIATQVESILENPDVVLRKQLDKAKTIKINELKAAGVEYDERMVELEKVEYPKPNREFIYDTFNNFVGFHPWLSLSNIRPKSIAREMFAEFYSFAEYINAYGLQRSEGVLLRYLSQFYKTLVQTVPEFLRTDELEEIIHYFGTMIRQVDSSLLDEWEKMKNPLGVVSPLEQIAKAPARAEDIIHNKRIFTVMLRNECFRVVRALASGDFEAVLGLLKDLNPDEPGLWTKDLLKRTMEEYWVEHQNLCTDQKARNPANTIISYDESKTPSMVEVILTDPDEYNDWHIIFAINIKETQKYQKPIMELKHLQKIGI